MTDRFQVITPLEISWVDAVEDAYLIVDHYFSLPGPHSRVTIDKYDAVWGDERMLDRHGDSDAIAQS